MRRFAIAVAVLAACGDDAPTTIDAPFVADAPPLDAAEPDASAGDTVTVRTYGRCCGQADEPLAGVAVFVRGPDGALVAEGVTDAVGVATLAAVANASVTAIYDADQLSVFHAVTYLGAAPGDDLTFASSDSLEDPDYGAPVETMDVTWTAPGGVDRYSVVSSCDRQEVASVTSAAIGQYVGCLVTDVDVLVTALDGGGQPVSSAVRDDVAFVADGTLAMPAFGALAAFDASATALPLSITAAQFSVRPVVGTRPGPGSFVTVDNTTGSVTSATTIPDGADGTRVETLLFRGNDATQQFIRVVADGVDQATSSGTDDVLPWVAGVTGDRDTRTLSWTLDGSAAYDGVLATMSWAVGGGLFGGASRRWTVIAPPGTSLTWPELPAAHTAAEVPTDRNIDVSIELIDSAAVGDYRDFRDLGEHWIRCPECAPLDPATFPPVKRSLAAGDLVAE